MKRFVVYAMIGGALFLAILVFLQLRAPRTFSRSDPIPANTQAGGAAKPEKSSSRGNNSPALPAKTNPVPTAALVQPDDSLAALNAFSTWAEQFQAGNSSASVARGEALAWKRREAMLNLIETNPEKALALAVPYRWRFALPVNVTRYFEQWVDGRGALDVFVATDFEHGRTRANREAQVGGKSYQTFVYGRRLSQVSQSHIPLHGIALDGKLALQTDPVRILDSEEAGALEKERGQPVEKICGVSGNSADSRNQPVATDIGGEIKFFCGVDHARLVNERLTLAESGADGGSAELATAANDAWTHGPKTVLYMRVNFPDDLTEPISEAAAYNVMDGVNDFYTEGSYDLTSLSPTVTPLMTLPNTKWWYSTAGPGALINDAREAARHVGFETANYDLDIVAFTTVPDYDFGGLAAVHGKSVWLQSTGVGVTAHELGHNYGLWHANLWDTSTNFSVIGPGTNLEYGNIFDTMGDATAGNNQFNATHKNILDWLPDTAVQNVTSNGVYRIFAFDTPSRVNGLFYAAKVRKDFQRDYWIEYRQKFTANAWLQNGVLLDWAPWPQSNGGTQLIDTTPGTPTGSQSREDAALVIGRTFNDDAAGVYITPLARGTAGTNVWIDVQVNLGASPANNPPVMQIEIDPPNAAPGALVHFHATASDAAGDALAYAWTFDDLSFSTNNLPWTFKSWTAAGDHVVRCVVSDMKGGVASANTVVTVGVADGFRITGRVTDTNGVPLEGVRVDNGPVTNSADYMGGYTDSDGAYVIVEATGDITLNAYKYGFTFTNLTWTSPLSVTNNLSNIDFIAMPLPSVSLAVSTNTVTENSTDKQFFTLTRTGDTTNDLTVNLNLSGSARVSSDFTLSPALASGTNTIVIPSGTQSVVFTFQTINDTSIEGPETATLTLLEDPAIAAFPSYVIAPLGEAAITILDDDSPAQPAVSVTAVTPTIIENGTDSGTFLFSRIGSTQNDLTVFYSVGGTATPGVDYGSLVGVVIIPAGSATVMVQFNPIDDKNVESDETVVVTITPKPTYTVSGSSAQVKIMDDDLLTVTIFPTDSSAAEPSTPGRFSVKREGDLTGNLVVNYTVSGAASNGVDYVSLPGSVIIPSGMASADIVLTPIDDNLTEGDESVILTLVTNVAYNIGTPGAATLFIRDDEKVSVSITATDNAASEPGDNTGRFQISRGPVVNGNLTVNFAISGTATPGVDYVPLDNPVVIPDGASSVSFDLIVFDDLHQEPTEDVILTLLPSTNYNLGSPNQAKVTIADDDANSVPAVGFCFAASSAPESQSPGVAVSLSATSTVPIMVDYRVIGGTATSGSDYTLPQGTLTFAPGERAKSIALPIVNDSIAEPNETIRIALFNPVNATLDGIKIHTYTIVDDDTSSVSVTATASSATENGTSGNFRISRSGATNADLPVNFQLTGTASAPADYAPLGASVTIPAGIAFVDLPVMPVNDPTVERLETVVITLLTAPGAKIVSPNVATVIINDNDTNTLPVVTITSTNHPYAVEGGGSGEFLFTRNGTNGALTILFSIAGTATSGADFTALPGGVTIPDGQNSVTLPVIAIDDALIEGEETVVASLTVSNTYRVAYPSSATVTIQDNDQRVRIDASDFTASEPGTDTGEFTFTRFGTTNGALQVFFTISGTASNGVDYVAISNSFAIPAGRLTATLPILPIDDFLVEGPETVTLTLQSNALYTLDQPTSATVTIQDDEPMLTIVATLTNIVEGSRPPAAFRITRTGDPRYELTARLSVGGTATYGVDYPPFLTNVYFTCGVLTIDLLVAPTNELMVENTETVIATLQPDPAYTILSPSNAVINIVDAATNHTPVVTITSPSAGTVFLLQTNVGIILEATVTDDNDTNTPLTLTWTNVSGPDSLAFGTNNQASTTVIFTNAGVYVLRLTADDGQLTNFAEVTVVVDAVDLLSTNLLHWRFDEGSGTNVFDTSGAGRNGVLTGAPNWQTNGILGGAVRFSGTNDYARQTSGTNFLTGLKAFSLSLWVNSTATNAAQGIFSANDSGTNATLSLSTKTFASCGNVSNVIEATLATTAGSVRRISAGNMMTNGWQHLMLTWSNGLAPALFINGQLDQPLSSFVALKGVLTNCPQFLVGKGPADSPNSWNGSIDDVRVFPRIVSAGEIAALAALPPTNYGAVVDAGSNVTVQVNLPFTLAGVVTDDGKPNPPGALSNTWSLVSGPAPVTITNANNLTNTVLFTQSGEYVFRLIADDGQVKVFEDVTVTVIEPTLVSVFASDSEAAELGPDTGEFTITRAGDLNFDLTVYLALSGTASNGADFIALTNAVTFTGGTDTLTLTLTPFLDDRIEGDETANLTIVSNLAYFIGNATATVTIHDSPYGQWSVQHFSLEELTIPALSGQAADPDHDGYGNFVEYAFNRDPKFPETDAPLAMSIETTNSLKYFTLTYHRRLPPTDTSYVVSVSNDLLTWNTGTNYVEEIQTTDDGNGLTETVKARLIEPFPTADHQFVTVRVRLLTTGP